MVEFLRERRRLENFTARALSYLTGRPRAETEKIPARDREDQLLAILDREPHLVVLDGLERELVAYARLDAAHLSDDDLDAKTAHARRAGLADRAAQSVVGDAKLRQTADPRTERFLRRLTQVRAARILVTTRLFPYALQDFEGEPLAGMERLFLSGLSDDDAVALWRSAGISGSRDALVPLFRSVDGHPLLLRALAGELARDRRSPGDFEKWKERHPAFNPFALPLVQRKSHLLAYALEGLAPDELTLLRAISGFRMPAAYETLASLLVAEDSVRRPFSSDDAFDHALAELDERGLVGWDRLANRYDLHPIVRGIVWSSAAEGDRQAIAEQMRSHFEPLASALSWLQVNRLDELTPAIELYVSLIRLGQFDRAWNIFFSLLRQAMRWRMGSAQQEVELLEMLFSDGAEQRPRLQEPNEQAGALNSLGLSYQHLGRPASAVACFQRAIAIQHDPLRWWMLVNLSEAFLDTGALHAGEASAVRGFMAPDAELFPHHGYFRVGLIRATRGDGDAALHKSLRVSRDLSDEATEGVVTGCLAQSAIWLGDAAAAHRLAERALKLSVIEPVSSSIISAIRLQGEAALAEADLSCADGRLHDSLLRARTMNQVAEELRTLTALANLYLRREEIALAREHLDAVWDVAERGPYPLLHADARNVLAEIEIHDGSRDAAITAATAAYGLAWCDGPPFAYDYGLRTARAHLRALGAPEPEMPPYDASKHEPIEEIDIEPDGDQAQ